MILYTILVAYLTGCLIMSTLCNSTYDPVTEEESDPTFKDRFMVGIMWPYAFYKLATL